MVITKVLKSGVRVAINSMKGFEGVSFKMFVFTGSGSETNPKDYGISHLIEHMFFKGTKTRSSQDIVKEFDDLGIQTNAYTGKSETCFFTYGTGDSLEKSVEIMSDMLFNSVFDEVELEREKEVVIEEIKMYNDRPDAVCELAMDNIFFEGTPYAHDIAGSEKSVKNISREQILNYFGEKYIPINIVLSFAGNVESEKALELVEKYFEPYFKQKGEFVFSPVKTDFKITKKQLIVAKKTNQAQVSIAYQTENKYDKTNLYKNVLISQILGGSMGSRLFQEVREKLGLVYTISCYNDTGIISGMLSINFGTSLKKLPLALKTIKKVLNEVCKDGFKEEELMQAKNIIISAIKLRSDSPSSEASNIAMQYQYSDKILSKNEHINKYASVTLEDINNRAKEIFEKDFCITMCGNKSNINLLKYLD